MEPFQTLKLFMFLKGLNANLANSVNFSIRNFALNLYLVNLTATLETCFQGVQCLFDFNFPYMF